MSSVRSQGGARAESSTQGRRPPAGENVARTSSSAKREITASKSRATRHPRPAPIPSSLPSVRPSSTDSKSTTTLMLSCGSLRSPAHSFTPMNINIRPGQHAFDLPPFLVPTSCR